MVHVLIPVQNACVYMGTEKGAQNEWHPYICHSKHVKSVQGSQVSAFCSELFQRPWFERASWAVFHSLYSGFTDTTSSGSSGFCSPRSAGPTYPGQPVPTLSLYYAALLSVFSSDTSCPTHVWSAAHLFSSLSVQNQDLAQCSFSLWNHSWVACPYDVFPYLFCQLAMGNCLLLSSSHLIYVSLIWKYINSRSYVLKY